MVYAQQRGSAVQSITMVADAMRLIQAILDDADDPRTRGAGNTSSDLGLMHNYVQTLRSEFFEATTIDAACSSLGLPRRTFTKLFAEETGMSWLSFVRGLAIDHAKERLRVSEIPIPSVAFECGFNDLSTFYRQFKRQVGKSPNQYRAENS